MPNNNWSYEDIYNSNKEIINKPFGDLFADELIDKNKWGYLSSRIKLDSQILDSFKNQLNWISILFNPTLTLDLIDLFPDFIDWEMLSMYYKMPVEFIEKHKYDVNWGVLYEFHMLPEGYSITF